MYRKLIKTIDGLLRFDESPQSKTSMFMELKHNSDLCPNIESQINLILNSFEKYRNIAYDIQGFRDEGTDVVLRFGNEDNQKFIAFQIKSYDDLQKGNYLEKIKLQYHDSYHRAYRQKLEHYYLLLCTDINSHRNKIRQIKCEYQNYHNATVINPTYMATFYRLNELRINSYIETLVKEGDYIYKEALKVINDLTPTEIALLLSIVEKFTFDNIFQLEVEDLLYDKFINNIYDTIPDFPRDYYFFKEEKDYFERERPMKERFTEDLDRLVQEFISVNQNGSLIILENKIVLPLISILIDVNIRYNYTSEYLLMYIFNSLGIIDRFKLSEYFLISEY